MEQKPIKSDNFVSSVIVNDLNYAPINEEVFETVSDKVSEPETEFKCGDKCHCCSDKTEKVCLNPCEDFEDFTVHNVYLHCEGRILKIKVQLKEICKGRKIRLAVLFYEKECREYELRGIRTCEVYVPGAPCSCLHEFTVGDFCFILPEEDICKNHQEVKVEVLAHYSSFSKKYTLDD